MRARGRHPVRRYGLVSVIPSDVRLANFIFLLTWNCENINRYVISSSKLRLSVPVSALIVGWICLSGYGYNLIICLIIIEGADRPIERQYRDQETVLLAGGPGALEHLSTVSTTAQCRSTITPFYYVAIFVQSRGYESACESHNVYERC